MTNLVEVTYAQTGKSKSTNGLGMREMQEKAYEGRTAQYLLLKAPPASGKSRALMFIALDKLQHQGIKKVIVAVPEKSIGTSFSTTELKKHGFFADWKPNHKYNLCTPGTEKSKVTAFLNFLESKEQIWSFLPIPRYGSKLDFHPSFFPLAFLIEHCLQVDRSDEFVKIECCGNIIKLKSAIEVDMLPSDRGDLSKLAHFK